MSAPTRCPPGRCVTARGGVARWGLIALTFVGCTEPGVSGGSPAVDPPRPASPSVDGDRHDPVGLATASVEPEDPVTEPEPIAPAAPVEWSGPRSYGLTTLVISGPESMIGARGHYRMVVEDSTAGSTVELRKIGENGRRYRDDRVLWGRAEAREAPDDGGWPGLRRWVSDVRISAAGGGGQTMHLELWLWDDQIAGIWTFADERWMERHPDTGLVRSRVRGSLRGREGATELQGPATAEQLPCPVCCELVHRCSGQGPRTCNGSNACFARCEEHPEGAVPTPGCGSR